MALINHITRIAEVYCCERGLSISRVSTLVFNDGKRLSSILAGGDLYTSRYEHALAWFSANWPEGAEWPADVPRPDTPTLAPEAADENDNQAAENLSLEECGA